jgi:creatinine amidohydrolase
MRFVISAVISIKPMPTARKARRAWAALFCWATAALATAQPVHIDELTSPELRARVAAGATTVLIPIGGTEQNGPHMVLGKHNVRVRVLAEAIARSLGNAVVAPVLAYVPEGAIDPPAAHMRFSGTVSIADTAFEAVLEGAARSFRQHGLRDIVLLGDHGGYQRNLQAVAARLNKQFAKGSPTRVHALVDYYRVTQTAYVRALRERGIGDAEIGSHAGLADTALALAVDKSLVRQALLAGTPAPGVAGDPRRASAELGQIGVQQIVESSAAAIRLLAAQPR